MPLAAQLTISQDRGLIESSLRRQVIKQGTAVTDCGQGQLSAAYGKLAHRALTGMASISVH